MALYRPTSPGAGRRWAGELMLRWKQTVGHVDFRRAYLLYCVVTRLWILGLSSGVPDLVLTRRWLTRLESV